MADEVVFGTFLTRMGPITSIRRETGEIQIQEVTTKKPLTIHVIGASQLKTMPDMRAMFAPMGPPAPAPAAVRHPDRDGAAAVPRSSKT